MAEKNHMRDNTTPATTVSKIAHLLQRAVPLIEDERSPHLAGAHIRQALALLGDIQRMASLHGQSDAGRLGAGAAMQALRDLQAAEDASYHLQTAPEYFAQQDSSMAAALDLAGPLSPCQDGFVRVLIEYAQATMRSGQPDLSAWIPEVGMNASEKAARRAEQALDIADYLAA